MPRSLLTLAAAAALVLVAPRLHAFAVEEASIADLQDAYREGRVTARQVTEACLARIAAYDKDGPYINAIITVNPRALAEADRIDAEYKSSHKFIGPLHGIPVVIKDNVDVVGMPMTSGFQGWKNYYPTADAPLAASIRASGAIIIAKTSLSEFAMGGGDNINSVLPGFARNPYNTAYATGGSSGGTGASVAASFAVIGIGTDTGGSVRMPSAHNALVGLRPTVGLISRSGMVPLDSVRDTPGPIARNVTDLAIFLNVLVKSENGDDPATARHEGHIADDYLAGLTPGALKGARLGVLRQVFTPRVADPRVIANFNKALAELKAAGAEIVDPFTVPELDTLPRPPQTMAQFRSDITAFIAKHPGIPYPSIEEIAASHLAHPLHQAALDRAATSKPAAEDPDTIAGAKTEQAYRDAFTRAMDAGHIDAVIFPTWAQLPAINGDRNTQITDHPRPAGAGGGAGRGPPTALGSSLTFVGSSLQWPAISVPDGYVKGLPQGLQILGRAWDEARLVRYAYAYEQATHYRLPPPSVPPLTPGLAAQLPPYIGTLESRFVGTWKLIEIRDRDAATGKETPSARGAAGGQLIYAANGRLSVQIVRAGQDHAAKGSADGFSSYFGIWQLKPNEGCVIHFQEGNLAAAQIGQAGKRFYSFDPLGHLSLATPPREGKSTVFVWERLP